MTEFLGAPSLTLSSFIRKLGIIPSDTETGLRVNFTAGPVKLT